MLFSLLFFVTSHILPFKSIDAVANKILLLSILLFNSWRAAFYSLVVLGIFVFIIASYNLKETNQNKHKINLKQNFSNYKIILKNHIEVIKKQCNKLKGKTNCALNRMQLSTALKIWHPESLDQT